MKKYLKRKMQDQMQDTQDVEVDMKDYMYLDIMSDEVDAKKECQTVMWNYRKNPT